MQKIIILCLLASCLNATLLAGPEDPKTLSIGTAAPAFYMEIGRASCRERV